MDLPFTANGPQDRESMLMRMQTSGFVGMPSVRETPKPKRSAHDIIESMDTDTIFRWFHVPFVVAELIWDRMEGVRDIAATLRVPEWKKVMRKVNLIRSEVNSIKNSRTHGMIGGYQEKAGQDFLDEIENNLYGFFNKVRDELKRVYGHLMPNDETLLAISAVHEARVLYHAIVRYNDVFRRFLINEYRLETKGPLPAPFYKLGDVLRGFGTAMMLDVKDNDVMSELIREMVELMYDVELHDDDGNVTTEGRFIDYIKEKKIAV